MDGQSERTLVFLGTGTSTGVPMLGCDCQVCTSTDPRNQRTRPSVLLKLPAGNLLIDTTPELRVQMLRERVGFAHAVVYTHHHVDHLFGLDEVRLFSRHIRGAVPVYCEQHVEATIRTVFSYAFSEVAAKAGGGVPRLHFHPIAPGQPFQTLGQSLMPIRLEHGRFPVLGFRIDDLAYCTDVSKIPEESWPLLRGLDTLVLDALRFEPHPTHFNLEQAMEVIRHLKPRRAYLTHLSHAFDHASVESILPPGVALAYDGLAISF